MTRWRALSARDFLEPPQGLDVIVEVRDAIHGVQDPQAGAESTPAVRLRRPALRVSTMHAQPALDAELGRIAFERLELFLQCGELLLRLRVGRHDRHPAVAEPGRTPHRSV